MQKQFLLSLVVSIFLISCSEKQEQKPAVVLTQEENRSATAAPVADTIASAASILQREQIPILCYHRFENNRPAGDYNVTIPVFKEQLKMLADSGYHTVLPDQLYDYLAKGGPLPPKPFMLTFDDTRLEHKQIADIKLNHRNGWISFGIDGKYAYASSGDVIDTKTKKIVASVVESEKLLEIQFQGDKTVRVGTR